MTRYFKATDGKVTVFRQARTDVYRWAHFNTVDLMRGPSPIGEISWSIAWRDGAYPTMEIAVTEYVTLGVLKARRIHSDYGERMVRNSPQNSWVRNSELETLL